MRPRGLFSCVQGRRLSAVRGTQRRGKTEPGGQVGPYSSEYRWAGFAFSAVQRDFSDKGSGRRTLERDSARQLYGILRYRNESLNALVVQFAANSELHLGRVEGSALPRHQLPAPLRLRRHRREVQLPPRRPHASPRRRRRSPRQTRHAPRRRHHTSPSATSAPASSSRPTPSTPTGLLGQQRERARPTAGLFL